MVLFIRAEISSSSLQFLMISSSSSTLLRRQASMSCSWTDAPYVLVNQWFLDRATCRRSEYTSCSWSSAMLGCDDDGNVLSALGNHRRGPDVAGLSWVVDCGSAGDLWQSVGVVSWMLEGRGSKVDRSRLSIRKPVFVFGCGGRSLSWR